MTEVSAGRADVAGFAPRSDVPVSLDDTEGGAPLGVRGASVDVLVHLDHIEDPELIREGIALGVDSVMYDGSRLPYAENLRTTRKIASLCHDPAEAADFVTATGVDALAVAVGTSHAMVERTAQVDRALVTRLRDAVPVPLVLRGSSGLSDEELRGAVAGGMAKVNISTHLNGLFTRSVRQFLEEQPDAVDPRKYVRRGRSAVASETARLLRLLAG